MLKEYPKFRRGEIEEFYKKLPAKEKKSIEEYLTYRKARGVGTENKLKDIRRYILHLRYILEEPFEKIDLAKLRGLLAVINSSRLTNYVKNSVKTDLKNFLKYLFKDWSIRFSNLEDIKLNTNKRNEEKINSQTIFSKEDIEKLMKHETRLFYKAFLITQYEAGLRTIETRFLKWKDISFNVDGDISEINIYSTKTAHSRVVFVKEATFYLKKLKEEQENLKINSIYVFYSKSNPNKPIGKSIINKWFRNLTKKALGREGWCYLLRHSRATELYRLAEQNKISKEIAIKFMGHSEDMSKVYTHLDKKEIKEMLKSQVYKFEDIPEEKKHKLEEEIEALKKKIKLLDNTLKSLIKKQQKV